MDRALIADLRERFASEGGGGLVETDRALDLTALSAFANEQGARFIVLAGPRTKRALLEAIGDSGVVAEYFGRNWDALDEVFSYPEDATSGPLLIAWTDPHRLDAADAATFRSIVRDAAQHRVGAGAGPLVVVAGSSPQEGPMDQVPAAIRSMGKIHHVALIVASIETALGLWRDILGLPLETIMDIPQDGVRIAFLGVGESKVELVEPTDDSTGVARFLASKGEGFHHVCFEVPNLAETLLRLEIDGLELIDTAPRRGAEGPVAFLHPRSGHGVLIELIEAPGGPAWHSLGFEPSR
jgi:methylmalonyl-CoA/ethylmalonyl-CoA epimerase